jgi:hypothetical protein
LEVLGVFDADGEAIDWKSAPDEGLEQLSHKGSEAISQPMSEVFRTAFDYVLRHPLISRLFG